MPSRWAGGARGASLFSLPITFEPNVGQAEPGVQFSGLGHGLHVFLTEDQIAVAVAGGAASGLGVNDSRVGIRLARAEPAKRRPGGRSSHRRGSGRRPSSGRKRTRSGGGPRGGTGWRAADATAQFAWRGTDALPGQSNYFIGSDPRAWRTHVRHYQGVTAENALPGVGMNIYGNEEGVEYDLRVKGGVDASVLRLEIAGNGWRAARGERRPHAAHPGNRAANEEGDDL